jgi:hypothetical protein
VSHSTDEKGWFGSRRKSGLIPACAGMVACAALIVPIRIPREISERVALEPSGAVWSTTLARYVMVSDDVNEEGKKHVPLLFALTEDGQLDAAPISIEGIAELNDPESITAAPDGTLFVSTSHSLNKHGHLPQSRRRLLHLSLGADRKAKIIGQVDLTTARSQDGSAPWGQDGRLDIEGLAFRYGSLYIGLKSPLGADGSATVLRLPDAVATLNGGSIPVGALSVWARARFCISHEGASVCEGIADLAFLPDGTLLVAGNSPKGMPTDGGGSLWKFAGTGSVPILLKRFEGLKPEGVALSPDHGSVIVVFDTDRRQPLWTRWSLSP